MWIEDLAKAQKLSDRFSSLNWLRLLTRSAKKVNPLFSDLLASMSSYWVTTQSEYFTATSHQLLAIRLSPRSLESFMCTATPINLVPITQVN